MNVRRYVQLPLSVKGLTRDCRRSWCVGKVVRAMWGSQTESSGARHHDGCDSAPPPYHVVELLSQASKHDSLQQRTHG
jgi:hypothetical protein